jgi:hypothetical protein
VKLTMMIVRERVVVRERRELEGLILSFVLDRLIYAWSR